MDLKHLPYANLGTNRLVLGSSCTRTQRELSSSIVRAKGPSRNNLSETNSDLKIKRVLRENKQTKTKIKKTTSRPLALSRIAFQTELKIKINKLQNNHQKIYNLLEILCDENFLVACYMLIKGKPGNMSPGTTPETLDGIDLP